MKEARKVLMLISLAGAFLFLHKIQGQHVVDETAKHFKSVGFSDTDGNRRGVRQVNPSNKWREQLARVSLNCTEAGHRNNIMDLQIDKGNKYLVFMERIKTFVQYEDAGVPTRNDDIQEWIKTCFKAWQRDGYITFETSGGTLCIGGTKTRGVRLDQQGTFNRPDGAGERITYVNLQLQVNVQRQSGQSTTIAAVLMDTNIPADSHRNYVIGALYRSLNDKLIIQVRRCKI